MKLRDLQEAKYAGDITDQANKMVDQLNQYLRDMEVETRITIDQLSHEDVIEFFKGHPEPDFDVVQFGFEDDDLSAHLTEWCERILNTAFVWIE
jgi:hypothetical protein